MVFNFFKVASFMNQCEIFEFDISICVDPANYGRETILRKTEREREMSNTLQFLRNAV
jgi:hypothetical protein